MFGVGKDYTNASHLGSPFSRKYTSVGVGVGAAFHSIVIVGRKTIIMVKVIKSYYDTCKYF